MSLFTVLMGVISGPAPRRGLIGYPRPPLKQSRRPLSSAAKKPGPYHGADFPTGTGAQTLELLTASSAVEAHDY